MRMNETRVRQIVKQEMDRALRESVRVEPVLTSRDIKFLRLVEPRNHSLNESWEAVGDALLKAGINLFFSILGRRLVIIALKAIRGFGRWQLVPLIELPKWVWTKAYDYLKEKSGVSLPVTPAEFLDFMSYTMPAKWMELASDELIKLLDDTTDKEFQEAVAGKNKEKEKLPGKEKEKLPDADKEKPSGKPTRRSGPAPFDRSTFDDVIDAEWSPVEPKQIGERRMRALVRTELAKLI